MVLADTRASADTEEGREKRFKSAERAEREGARAIADDMVPLALAPSTVENRPDVVQRMRAMAEANSPKGIAAAQRGMAHRRDSQDLLSQMTFPVQIIAGSEDKLTSVREAESMRDKIPNARFHIIEGAGHLSNLERPGEFNSVLAEFIRGLK
jgi:pimeloyl-ACP methyl ester carboxylesterase